MVFAGRLGAREIDGHKSIWLGPVMRTQSVGLFVGYIVKVVTQGMVEILNIFLKEADKVGILTDQLPAVWSSFDTVVVVVDIIVATSNKVVLTRVILIQHRTPWDSYRWSPVLEGLPLQCVRYQEVR